MQEYYLIVRKDAPDSGEKRLAAMEAHLKYSKDNIARFMVGGALRSDPDAPALGSAMVVKADNIEDARAFADLDPFAAAGVYAETDVMLFRVGLGEWIGGVKF